MITPQGIISGALRSASPCILLIAGLSKAWDAAAFSLSLGEWRLIPSRLTGAISIAVICAEIGIGAGWALDLRRGLMERLAPGVLALFTSVYLAHLLVLGAAPACHCLGGILAARRMQHEAQFVIGRNAVLIAASIAGLLLPRRLARAEAASRAIGEGGRAAPPAPWRPPRGEARAGTPGFTLLEMLVALAAVAILIATLIPSLRGVARRAETVQTLSNLRGHATAFQMYAIDYQESHPWFTLPDAVVRLRADDLWVSIHYWYAYNTWNIALAPGYYAGNCRDPSFSDPRYLAVLRRLRIRPLFSTYLYSSAFLADPRYWAYRTREEGSGQLHATRTHQVTYPSKKALLLSSWPGFVTEQFGGTTESESPIAFTDGSAREVAQRAIRPGYIYGTGGDPKYTAWVWDSPTMCTLDGVRGRDVD